MGKLSYAYIILFSTLSAFNTATASPTEILLMWGYPSTEEANKRSDIAQKELVASWVFVDHKNNPDPKLMCESGRLRQENARNLHSQIINEEIKNIEQMLEHIPMNQTHLKRAKESIKDKKRKLKNINSYYYVRECSNSRKVHELKSMLGEISGEGLFQYYSE